MMSNLFGRSGLVLSAGPLPAIEGMVIDAMFREGLPTGAPVSVDRIIRLLVLCCLAATAACTSIERLALPSAGLDDRHWETAEPASLETVDHDAWDDFLAAYVRTDPAGVNRVDYGTVTIDDRMAIDAYLERLQAIPVSRLSRDEQLAFWVNLYNARTLALILENYPVDSIRDIRFGLLSFGPWDEPVVRVEGRTLSLNDIEHRVIRPVWRDRRVHYILNCAATGCPNLGSRAYTGDSIDRAMDDAARAYVNDPRGASFDADGWLTVSKIYGWFREDFGGDHTGVLAELRRHADAPLGDRLAGRESIDAYAYDWSLNDAAGL